MREINEIVKPFTDPRFHADDRELEMQFTSPRLYEKNIIVAGNEMTVDYCYYFQVKEQTCLRTIKELRISGRIIVQIKGHKITEARFQEDLAARLRQELRIAA